AKLETGRSLMQFWCNRRVTSACWTIEVVSILETAEQRLTSILGITPSDEVGYYSRRKPIHLDTGSFLPALSSLFSLDSSQRQSARREHTKTNISK
ncbi:hypothetical protein ALC56_10927, partial [Trachymyrmex septentrionalis]